ncbi:threonine synthase [Micromonospora marina]|uniref:threonine synthase n=1 Tax=Micromonospora marina TaxID=307120 RepID=UPI003D71F545
MSIPWNDHDGAGMWRYRGLLPIDDQPIRFPLPVGGTPLLADSALRSEVGMRNLWVKDETVGPSASNKDRATALVLEIGLRRGASTITTASTGNAGVATAIGARYAGLAAVIFVPADCDRDKVEVMRDAGAHVLLVRAGYKSAFNLSRAAAREFNWLDRNTGVNPVTLEAKKTVAFEIWEQLGRCVPDTVVAPVGDGPTLVALARGFRELRDRGVTSTVPRLIGVQAEGCQPLVRRWRGLPARAEPVRTVADGIRVTEPALGSETVREVSDSAGAFVAVPDEEIQAAVRLLESARVPSEPAGAAALAGLRRALEQALVGADEQTVVLVTGAPFRPSGTGARRGSQVLVSGSLDEVADAWKRIAALHSERPTA